MDQFPNLFTTKEKFDSSTDSSGEWDSEILRLHTDDLVDPTELNFGKVSKFLSKEGREKVKALRANSKREELLRQNPNTPITNTASAKTWFNIPTQAQLN